VPGGQYHAGTPMSTPPPLRVGIAAPFDPRDMQADSGAAASVLQAMGELVAEAVPLSGALAPRLARLTHLSSLATRMRPRHLRDPREAARFLHSAAQLGRPTIAARNRLMRRRLQAAGPLDGIVQRGCELVLPPGQRFVTFEDSTVLQALSYPWPHLKALSDGDIQRYTERQRRVYAAARACCATTQWAADSITGSYGIEPERVFVVGLGQNHPPAQLQPRDWSTPRFLFVGVDWTRKNGPAVVQAFTRVRERHPNAQLDVVGGHPQPQPALDALGGLLGGFGLGGQTRIGGRRLDDIDRTAFARAAAALELRRRGTGRRRHTRGDVLLAPGGRLVVTSVFAGKELAAAEFDLVLRATAGCWPLPKRNELLDELKHAGFSAIEFHRLAAPPLYGVVADAP